MCIIDEKVLVSVETCREIVSIFESEHCIDTGKNSQYSSFGKVGVIPPEAVPEEFKRALQTLNIKPFNFETSVHSAHALIVHRYNIGESLPEHRDDNISNYGSIDKSRALRYKTLVLQLTDPNEYKGGELKIGEFISNKSQGSICMFNSGCPHEVLPVLKGTRYSAALWLHREDFNEPKSLL